jgi:parallel beta-helix repeat protein
MKMKFVISFVLLYVVIVVAGITNADAKDIVLNNILGDEIERVNVFESDQILTSQNSVTLWNGETISSQYENSWFYFVDDRPIAKWHHPCRLIFINEANGEYEIINKTIFPMDYEKEMVLISKYDKQDAVEVSETTVSNQIEKALPNEHLYAVIVNGSEGEEVRFWNDMSAMYCTLLDKGYTKDNIYVHYYGETHSSDLDGGDYFDDVDYDATKSLIEATFARLSTELDYDDQLFVYIDGHGNNSHIVDGVNDKENEDDYVPASYIDLKGEEDISAIELAGYVENINCAQMVFTIGLCYSGGFASKLNEYTTDTKCTNRTVHTASFNEEALAERWLTYYEGDSRYHEFFYYWIAAIRGYFPGVDAWGLGELVDEFPFIEILESNQRYLDNVANGYDPHPGAKDPDFDGDGYLQMNDVFRYTNDLNSWTENGYNNPYSTDYVDELPQNSYNDVLISKLLSMKGLCGNIEPSNTQEKLSYPPYPIDLEEKIITGNLMVNPKLTIKPGVSLNYVGDKTMTFVPGDPDEAKISYKDGLVIESLSKFVIENSHLVFEEGSQLSMLDWSFFEAKGNISITGNVVTANTSLMSILDNSEMHLNSGSNLTIADGAILDVGANSSLIVESGANMIFEPNSNVKVFGNLVLKNNETFTYGTHIELFAGSKLIVEEGANLNIEDNVVIDVYEGAEIFVNRDASLETVHPPILPDGVVRADPQFNYIPTVGYWNGITCDVGSTVKFNSIEITNAVTAINAYSADVYITNSSFTDCENGVSLVNCENYDLRYNNFEGNGIGSGIALTYCYNPITGNTISNFGIGVKIVSSSVSLAKNTISNNIDKGLFITGNGSKPTLINVDLTQKSVNNDIINNGLNSIYYARSQIYMRYSAGVYMTNGYNNVYSGANGTLPAVPCIKGIFQPVIGEQYINKVVISAEMNYWGYPSILDENWGYFFSFDYNPFGDDTGYSIDYAPYGLEPFTEGDPYPAGSLSSNEPPSIESTLLFNAMRLEQDDKYTPSIKLYEKIIEKYPDSEEYYVATARLPYVYEEVAEPLEQLFSTYDEALASEEITNKKFFKQMKVSTKIKDKKYDEAIALAEVMKEEATTDEEKALSDIDIAIANMMKNARGKGNGSGASSTISDLLAKLTEDEDKGETSSIDDGQFTIDNFTLEQNYPNPFNPVTQIRFALPITSEVKLSIFNINGQLVSELINGNKEAGIHKVNFDATNFNSGMYFYTLEANGISITKKMILTK